ncbi:hypothetical protein DRQ25_16530 [Candidatus Fermentibacteria bacterium]|nr:MAG: hypothetical protein DRQ25_16530 [Candidatus Fermentibacteria bacterium]
MTIGKKVLMAIAAMIVISIVAVTVSAICAPTVCEKNCSTKVEQCDVEAVMALDPVPEGAQVVTVNGDVYIDMTGNDNRIGAGDIRLTETCCGAPNSKVMPHDNEEIGSVFTILDQDIFTYMDSNANGIFDVGDAIYLDVDNDDEASVDDIRLTDSPPFDVLDSNGDVAIPSGEYGYAWSCVGIADADFGADLVEIGTDILPGGEGTLQALGGTIDGDCSGDWTCPDKLYLNQPTGLPQFDNFVTIGDLRLYMPNASDVMPVAMGECFDQCGTRVRQCAKDAVYALRVDTGATWGYTDTQDDDIFTPGDHNEGGYIDMDNDGVVSAGDVRVTSANSLEFDPNTKVADCDGDIDRLLETPAVFYNDEQTVFRYIDLDEEPGYSLGDPVYMDVDDSDDVSKYDIRITQSPVCEILKADGSTDVEAGEWGASWSIVELMDADAINDMPLTKLPDGDGGDAVVEDLLGFIDSDCNLCWSCPDKLYLQQLVGEDVDNGDADNYNLFVTIGDIRLYVPPAAIGDGPGEPCWEPCGTKVWQCDVDLVYALMDMPDGAQVRYVDEDADGVYSYENNEDGDGVYLDMDDNGIVSQGDIRLSYVCTQYYPNTKVGTDSLDHNDIDDIFMGATDDRVLYADIDGLAGYTLGDPLYLTMSAPYDTISLGDIRLTASPVYSDSGYGATGSIGEAWTRVIANDADLSWTAASGVPVDTVDGGVLENITQVFDSDCTQSWTCPDKLYLQQTKYDFVTIGDERLYIPAGPVSDDPCDIYDADGSETIELSEVIAAIDDYFDDLIELETVIDVMDCYFD